jgi:glycosyltransferase involved in cell wall biosynthesis
MKIAQVITLSEPIGGAQMVLYNNTEAMIKAGHHVHIIVGQGGTLTKRLEALNVPVTIIPSLRREISPKKDYQCYKNLRNTLDEIKPDIVISHSSKAGILTRLACHKNNVRNIFTAHGWSFTPGVRGIKRYLFLLIEKVMGLFTDHVITVSNFDRKQALKYAIVPDQKMKVIYNGSPDLTYKNIRKDSDGYLRILMVARFQYPKDHDTLFKAVTMVKDEKIKVDLIGSGEHEETYKSLAKELKIDHLITFHGESNEVPTFLNQADVFVLTSIFEALPLSICEAMSVGIPILASNVGGIHEMVKNDYNGYLVPAKDHTFLAERIKQLIRDEKLLKRLGENSRKTFDETFSIHKMWTCTENYIKQIVQD